MTMSLAVAALRKSFNGREVLQGVNLDVNPGEIFAVVGPSGVGKTTLLRILDFLLVPDAGVVRYDGREAAAGMSGEITLRRRMSMVPQNPRLFRGTVFYNASYGLCVRAVERPELHMRTLQALEVVGLLDRTNARTSDLSAGEAQRVAFARAVVFRPDLLLLDEFTVNLDPANVNILETAVRAFNRSTGATVVLVTHDMFQAKRLARRVALLFEGRIIEAATVPEFFENPRDVRTRAFVRGEIAY